METNKHIEYGYHEAEQSNQNCTRALCMLVVVFFLTTLIFCSLFINELHKGKEYARQLNDCQNVKASLEGTINELTYNNLNK